MEDPTLAYALISPFLGTVNLLLKRYFGADLYFAGADLALCGSSVLISSMAGALLRGNLPLGGEGLSHFIYCGVALVTWFICLAVASKKTLLTLVSTGLVGSFVLIRSASYVHNLIGKGVF